MRDNYPQNFIYKNTATCNIKRGSKSKTRGALGNLRYKEESKQECSKGIYTLSKICPAEIWPSIGS